MAQKQVSDHYISERKVEKYLLNNIRSQLDAYVIRIEAEETQKRRQPKVQDILALNEQLRRLNVIFIAGNISDEEYAAETKRLKAEIESARNQGPDSHPVDLDKIKALLQTDFLATYQTMNKENQRRLWRSLVEEIYIDGCNVTGIKPRI